MHMSYIYLQLPTFTASVVCRLSGCRFVLPLQMNVNPEDLIPKLPQPKDLQPFPTTEAIVSLLYFSTKKVIYPPVNSKIFTFIRQPDSVYLNRKTGIILLNS